MRQEIISEFMNKKFMTILILGACLILLKPAIPEAVAGKKYSRIIWNYLETLCAFGPRNPGSEGYMKTIELIRRVGEKYADRVIEKPFQVPISAGKKVRMVNLELQFAGTQGGAPILIGSHFDTRPFADQETDPEKRNHADNRGERWWLFHSRFASSGAISFSTPGPPAHSSGVF